MEQLKIWKPDVSLRKYIRFFWTAEVNNSENSRRKYQILADGFPGLIFQHYNGRTVFEEENGTKLPVSFIYGQATGSCTNYSVNNFSVIGIQFQPDSLKPLFKIDADEFTNKLTELNNLVKFDINDRLLNTSNFETRIRILYQFIFNQIKDIKGNDRIIENSIEVISGASAKINPDSLFKEYSISERQFQRRFKYAVGISPYQYIKILKFRNAISILNNSDPDRLSDIAFDLYYSDQSHFIREFKKYSGFTPKQYLMQKMTNSNSEKDYANTKSIKQLPERIVLCN